MRARLSRRECRRLWLFADRLLVTASARRRRVFVVRRPPGGASAAFFAHRARSVAGGTFVWRSALDECVAQGMGVARQRSTAQGPERVGGHVGPLIVCTRHGAWRPRPRAFPAAEKATTDMSHAWHRELAPRGFHRALSTTMPRGWGVAGRFEATRIRFDSAPPGRGATLGSCSLLSADLSETMSTVLPGLGSTSLHAARSFCTTLSLFVWVCPRG